MMKRRFFFVALSLMMLPSCNIDRSDDCLYILPDCQTIYACPESSPSVRNVVDDATLKITWTSGDAINVFFGASESSKFVTSDAGDIAQFKGSIDVVTGGGEGLTDETSLWGVYPYNPSNTCDGTHVTLTLPSIQEAAENTFANGLFPQIARSYNFYMTFYNLCGSIRFMVVNSDIKRVTLSGNNGEEIAGKAYVSMDGTPAVEEILAGETELTMYAPDGGYFTPGVNYYFVLYPTAFTNGLTITYYKEDTHASYVISASSTLGRNKFVRLNKLDSGLTWVTTPLNEWEEGEKVEGEI